MRGERRTVTALLPSRQVQPAIRAISFILVWASIDAMLHRVVHYNPLSLVHPGRITEISKEFKGVTAVGMPGTRMKSDPRSAVIITEEVTRVVLARVVEYAERNGHFAE